MELHRGAAAQVLYSIKDRQEPGGQFSDLRTRRPGFPARESGRRRRRDRVKARKRKAPGDDMSAV